MGSGVVVGSSRSGARRRALPMPVGPLTLAAPMDTRRARRLRAVRGGAAPAPPSCRDRLTAPHTQRARWPRVHFTPLRQSPDARSPFGRGPRGAPPEVRPRAAPLAAVLKLEQRARCASARSASATSAASPSRCSDETGSRGRRPHERCADLVHWRSACTELDALLAARSGGGLRCECGAPAGAA